MRADFKGLFLSVIAAGFLIATGSVQAQQGQQDLSAQEVKDFLAAAEQDLTQAVRAGDYERLLDWTENNLAEGAIFSMSQEFYVGDERKGFAVTSLDKQDMLRLGRVAVGAMSGMPDRAVRDYALDIEVVNVDPIGPNAATVTTRIAESGKLALPRGAASGDTASAAAAEPAAGGDSIEIEATARCIHLVQRGEAADQLMIGLTTCEARAHL